MVFLRQLRSLIVGLLVVAIVKRVPVLTNSRACGPRQQVRDGLDGRSVRNPEDEGELQRVLNEMLADTQGRLRWGRTAQRHVYDRFLIMAQLRSWARLLGTMLDRSATAS